MVVCPSCEHEFDPTTSKKNIFRKYCSDKCKNRYRTRIKVRRFRKEFKRKCVEYLGGSCKICGYDKCLASLEFHHRDPGQKEFGIGQYVSYDWAIISPELDKCDLLCSNCHGEVHSDDM